MIIISFITLFLSTLEVPPKILAFSFPISKEGDKVFATCVVSEGDGPIRLLWLKNDQIVGEGNTRSTELITHRIGESDALVLQINHVKSIHAGNYTCFSEGIGGVAKHTSQLIVHGKTSYNIKSTPFKHDTYCQHFMKHYESAIKNWIKKTKKC